MLLRPALAIALLAGACAWAEAPPVLPARGTVQVAFPPWDDAEGLVVEAIRRARQQIRVQAFSFTSRALAGALIAARRRGVDVRVIADAEQAMAESSRLQELSAGGVVVLLDRAYQSAHSKVMLVDASDPEGAVITGSYNWTYAAQYRNAENLLILRGNAELARTYLRNWERHAAAASGLAGQGVK